MSAQPDGLIPRFIRAAAVPMHGRNMLKDRTVETYITWLKKFWKATCKPASQWCAADIEAFMWQMHRENYAFRSRKQALCAIIYVFKNVIGAEIGQLKLPPVPREHKLMRIIPSRDELARIFTALRGQIRIMAGLMYGAGLRVGETCELRMKDIDIEARTVRIHDGKRDRDRLTILPDMLVPALQRQMARRAQLHERDLKAGAGLVDLPGRLAIKYKGAPRELAWQFLFPSAAVRNGYRWYATPQGVQKAMKVAVHEAGILKRVTPHTLRHAFCTYAQQDGTPITVVQELMGHDDLNTTMIYSHADRAQGRSPLDGPAFRPVPVMPRIQF